MYDGFDEMMMMMMMMMMRLLWRLDCRIDAIVHELERVPLVDVAGDFALMIERAAIDGDDWLQLRVGVRDVEEQRIAWLQLSAQATTATEEKKKYLHQNKANHNQHRINSHEAKSALSRHSSE